jgi:hypothetical protein
MRAVLINSGQANACTGDRGLLDSQRATQAVADQLGLDHGDRADLFHRCDRRADPDANAVVWPGVSDRRVVGWRWTCRRPGDSHHRSCGETGCCSG